MVKKNIEDFKKGTRGITVEDGKVTLSKAGLYTFYASDYAGNEAIYTYEVVEDKTAPKISTSYTVASNYKTRTITVIVSDDQSGVKRVEYLPGVKKVQDFLPTEDGKEIKLKKGKGSFKVKKDGVYTIFATDHKGNTIVKQVVVKTVKKTKH